MLPILALTGALLLSPPVPILGTTVPNLGTPDTTLIGNWAALTSARNTDNGQTVQLVAVIRFAPDSFRATLKVNDGTPDRGSMAMTRGRWTTQKDPWGGNQLCVQIPQAPVHCQPYRTEGPILYWGQLTFNRETDAELKQLAPELLTGKTEAPGLTPD